MKAVFLQAADDEFSETITYQALAKPPIHKGRTEPGPPGTCEIGLFIYRRVDLRVDLGGFARASYYNLQSEGLGLEFAAEVKRALGRILQYPDAWTPLSKRTRRCRLNRFPYALLYQPRSDAILVVAVQNLHKHPDSWKSRLKTEEIQEAQGVQRSYLDK